MTRRLAILLALAAFAAVSPAQEARAFNPIKPVCGAAGFVNGVVGKACTVVQHAGRTIKAGKKLASGHVIGAVKTFLGSGGSTSSASTGSRAATLIGLAAIGTWVLGGAKFAMHETAKVLTQTTSPQLRSTWFSSTYWRMAALAAVFTLPFLFAAAVQALMRAELSLLGRAAFGYLPLAMLAVGIAAPLAMLLLVASDQLSAIVSSAAGNAGADFLSHTATVVGLLTIFSGSPFLAFLVGLFTAAAALTLWLELLVREAAVYVIVLMLPLAFAALVWPARRIWAIRAVELLVALILSKFAIVAVLSLGGAALETTFSEHSITGALAGGALVLLAAFAPWAVLRLLPLAELASGAAGSLRREPLAEGQKLWADAKTGSDRVQNVLSGMRDHGDAVAGSAGAAAGARAVDGAQAPLNGARATAQHDAPAEQQDAATGEQAAESAAVDDAPAVPGAADHDAAASAYSATEADAERAEREGRKERLPGMESRWQEENFSWPTLELDAEHLPPPEPRPEPLSPEREQPRKTPGERAVRPDNGASDDPDPRPAEQPPIEGRL